jgi:hypothetical protein
MNEAQKMFTRMTGGIYDVSSIATEVDVVTGDKYADLHPSILTIRQAYYGPDRQIKIINLGDAAALSTSDYGVVKDIGMSTTPGRVDFMVIGEERNKARWIMLPQENAIVTLAIARLPLKELSPTQQDIEIGDEHHVMLIEWMKSLAYSKHDGDMFNPTAAAEGEAKFRGYCDFVWREWDRYRHKPRSVAYGGI